MARVLERELLVWDWDQTFLTVELASNLTFLLAGTLLLLLSLFHLSLKRKIGNAHELLSKIVAYSGKLNREFVSTRPSGRVFSLFVLQNWLPLIFNSSFSYGFYQRFEFLSSRTPMVLHLLCPKCVELKLPQEGAAFWFVTASFTECFKASWSSHKSVHLKAKLSSFGPSTPGEQNLASSNDGWLYCLKKGQARTPKLPHFDWTGTLRPYPISEKRMVPAHIDQPDWAIDGVPKIELNSNLQHVVEISREVLDAAARVIQPGVTTDEIDEVVHEATIASGGYPSPLRYNFFPKSCCISVNEVICHGIPDARKLEDGDIVNVDVSVYYKGVHGDLSETFFVGNVDEASRQLVQSTYECLEKAISIVKPGVRFREIGEVINRHASLSGFSVVRSYCAHGIGELYHCAPNIPHYASVWRDRMWPDGWTVVTADGKRSAQFEHTLLVTETGVEVLTARLPSSPNVFPWLSS
ncbi:hypothetical protein TEA_010580 [Camellia sinensis var. sinensis]|uniref:Methionine aminopeptidase n=1 Tax=Camellia sinensis var. sinensis TaxID=542762 RepID=A0A4S4E2Y3_CAMSN|nr:hypothetical protein TEA_010580 [Camellia sinensis var. sinensis]